MWWGMLLKGVPPWPGLGVGSCSGPEELLAPYRAACMLPSSRGPWTPMGGCGCWQRVRRWLGTCPGPGGRRVPWHRGRRRRFCPLPVSPRPPQLALPRAAVFTLAVAVLTLPPDVSCRGRGRPSLSPAPQVPSTHLAGGRAGAGCRREHGEAVLGRGCGFGEMTAHTELCLWTCG